MPDVSDPRAGLRGAAAGPTWLVVATDGVTDAHWFETLASKIVARAGAGVDTAQEQCEAPASPPHD